MTLRLLQELGEELGLHSWQAEAGQVEAGQAEAGQNTAKKIRRFALEGGNEKYVLDAESSAEGLLLGLGVQLNPPEFAELAPKAATLAAEHEGLKAVHLEQYLYFVQHVPATATSDVLHQTLTRCLDCQRALRT